MIRMTLRSSIIGAVALAGLTCPATRLSTSHYVQEGLVTMFDAEDNEGTGSHNPNAAKWKDLKGSASITCRSGSSWETRYLNTATVNHPISGMPTLDRDSITVETAFDRFSPATSDYACIVTCGERFKFYYQSSAHTSVGAYMNATNSALGAHNSNIDGSTYKWVRTADNFLSGTFAFFSGATNYGTRANGVPTGNLHDSGIAISYSALTPANWSLTTGSLGCHYYSVRWYNRVLGEDEMKANAFMDKLRFRSYTLAGNGNTTAWSAVSWNKPYGVAVTAPTTGTNDFARVANATLAVGVADHVGLMGLSLEDGATLDIADGAVVAVKVMYVEDVAVERGIYCADGVNGRSVPWLSGTGILKVAGDGNRPDFPERYMLPGNDGWFQFGTAQGDYGNTGSYAGSTREYFIGEYVDWTRCSFPAGGNNKLRLVGHSLIGAIPSNTFSVVDLSQATIVQLYEPQMFEDGREAAVPNNVILRYQPGTWEYDESTGRHWRMTAPTTPYAGDIHLQGTESKLRVSSDNGLKEERFTGLFHGNGKLVFSAWGNRARFSGGFALNNYISNLSQGSLVWIDTTAVTSRLEGVTLAKSTAEYANNPNSGYRVNGLYFGKDRSAETADHELYLKYLNGMARTETSTTTGIRIRGGSVLGIWGGNTIHAGYVSADGSLHVLAQPQDLKPSTVNNWQFNAVGMGIGNFIVDEMRANSKLCLSSNVNVKVGNVLANVCFDYTFVTNGTNISTLDITNSCVSTAIVTANDIVSLPARLSGFVGTVSLVETGTKSYTMPIDMTQGTNVLYNTVGCIGSGTLAGAPAAGTINATFPTDVPVVKGEYALARFSSGGEALANWTVTLNGQALTEQPVAGNMVVSVVKDATGLWLNVARSGVTIIIR